MKAQKKVECKFELNQDQYLNIGQNNLNYQKMIANYLLSSVKIVKKNKSRQEYKIRTTSLNGNLVLENYLNRFPLFGSKYLDYRDWIKVLDLFKQGKFKHKSNIEEMSSIKSGMNDRRTVFNWDHLNGFYNLD